MVAFKRSVAADVDDDSSVRSDETADDYALDDGDNLLQMKA